MRGVQEVMTNYLGAHYGEHRRADAQTSCDSAGSSDPGHHRTQPLLITGDKTRDAALGEPRIRAGEIIGWRVWKLRDGLLHKPMSSVILMIARTAAYSDRQLMAYSSYCGDVRFCERSQTHR
jgi:hypothetical protein